MRFQPACSQRCLALDGTAFPCEALDHAGSCGSRIRTGDLRVMSPASYRTATTPLEPTIGHDPMTYALREHRSTI